jgi:hypothetical protein
VTHERRFTSVDTATLAAAAIAVSYALQLRNGFYSPAALAWMIAAAAAAALALSGGLPREPAWLSGRPLVFFVLLAGLAWSVGAHATARPGIRLVAFPSVAMEFRALVGVAVLLVALMAFDRVRARRWWFPAALALYAVMGVWLIRHSPDPHIDVYTVYDKAMDALVSGHSPYSLTFPNIYGTTKFYGPGMANAREVVFGFPYPPLALLMALPSLPLGDVRYAELAAMVIGAAAIGWSGRTPIAAMAATLLVFAPRGLFVIEQAWSEPFVICWLGLLVLAATRRSRMSLPLGALLAVKQHLVIALPFAPWLSRDGDRRSTRREIAIALAVAVAVTLPFAIADPAGFWRSVVALQFAEPFRGDSLSALVPIVVAGWKLPPVALSVIPLAAALPAGWLAWRRAPRSPAGFAAALGFVLAVLFLFSKKAFCNYYFLVLACWCAAVAAADADPEPNQGQTGVKPAATRRP